MAGPSGTVGSGLAGQLLAIQEVTYGVAPTLTNAIPLEFKTESMQLKKTTVQGTGIHAASAAGGLYPRSSRRAITNYEVSGAITMDLQARRLNLLLKHMMGSVGETSATLVQNGATGQWGSKHTPGPMNGNSLTFQIGKPATNGTVEPFTYVGCKIVDWTISVATGAIAELQMTIDGRNELAGAGTVPVDPLNVAVPSLQAWTNVAQDVFYFREAKLVTGTPTTASGLTSLTSPVTLANIKDASIKQTLALDSSRYFLGSSGYKAEQLENGLRGISGSFTSEFLSSESLYNAYSQDTPLAMQLSFVGFSVIGSSTQPEELDIIISNVKLDGESPTVQGYTVLSQSCSFTATDDEVNNPIQMNYFTSDTAD